MINLGAIPWLLTSELFNSEARSKANSIAVLVNWGCAFIVTVTFPFLEVKTLLKKSKHNIVEKIFLS